MRERNEKIFRLILFVCNIAPSRRGDLEILAYCVITWLGGVLPWKNKLDDENSVGDEKFAYVSSSDFEKCCTVVPSVELLLCSRLEDSEVLQSRFGFVTAMHEYRNCMSLENFLQCKQFNTCKEIADL